MKSFRAFIYRHVADMFPGIFVDPAALDTGEGNAGKRILIACSYFWPSIGGVESRIEQFAAQLVTAGYDVTVITPHLPGRDSDIRYGVKILSIQNSKRVYGLLKWPFAVRAAISSGHYDTSILIEDPRGGLLWCVENLPKSRRTKVFIQPIITAEGYAQWENNIGYRQRLSKLLHMADAAVAMTRTGPDVRFMLDSKLSPACIPNATQQPTPLPGFREKNGIDAQAFVVLHVANLWWYKNHSGLIDALNHIPSLWKLVLIGNPTAETDCARAVEAKLAHRQEILLLPGLNRHDVSAAMAAADVIVLPSFGEGSPNTILEAMAHGKPWLATPHCGGARDNAGGIICSVGEFGAYLSLLHDNEKLRHMLGQIGHRHWQACFSWDQVLKGWVDLIESGNLKHNYAMPAAIRAEMTGAKHALETLRKGRTGHPSTRPDAMRAPTPESTVVNIGMITCNRLEFTRQAIEALMSLEAGHEFILSVVDNGSSDGTKDFLKGLHQRGVIRHLVLLDSNIGVAKASNLAWCLAPEAMYYLKLDNDIVMHKKGWLGDMVAVAERLPEAGAVAYNFEPLSYPALMLHGVRVRPKIGKNLGGACILISWQTHERLGFWCEEYGLYGEEDADFGVRVECAGLFNIYMEDEDAGFHLPAGRAAKIGFLLRARDGIEEVMHGDYRARKDASRRTNMLFGSFKQNIEGYKKGSREIYQRSPFVEGWLETASGTEPTDPAISSVAIGF